jgi:hypothetical protein
MSNSLAENLPMQKALTSDMLLGLKTYAPKSRSYRVNISPSNKNTFSPQDQIIFDIPTGRKGTWLDQSQTYLKFSVQFASTAASPATTVDMKGINIDNSAYSFIQRLDVFNGSNPLESINQYGQLANYLIDQQLSQADKAGLAQMIGCNSTAVNFNNAGGAPADKSIVSNLYTPGDRSGMQVTSVTIASGINTAIPYTFTLPILSGIVGVNSSKMLCLKDLLIPITLQFFLSTNDDAICYGSAGAGAVWQIVNAELVCCFVEINEDYFNDSPDLNPPVKFISSKTYRQTTAPSIPVGTSGSIDLLVGLRASSVTQLIARFRNKAGATQGADASASYRLSSSVSPNISSYYWRIGSQNVPQKPVYLWNGTLVGSGAEGFAELSKAFHAIGSVICNGSITPRMYNVALFNTGTYGVWTLANGPYSAFGTQTTFNNAFSISQELETFSNRTDTILSGVDTNNSPIYLSLNLFTATVADVVTVDIFAQIDVIYKIENGQMSALW